MNRIRLPSVVGRRALGVALVTWAGVVVGGLPTGSLIPVVFVLAGVCAGWGRPRILFVLAALAGVVSGWWTASTDAAALDANVETGPTRSLVRIVTDPLPTGHGWQWIVEGVDEGLAGVDFVVGTRSLEQPVAGDLAILEGVIRSDPGWVRGHPVAASVNEPELFVPVGGSSPWHRVSNSVRNRLLGAVWRGGDDPARALVAGFLVGDTTRIPSADVEMLRRAGLSHFVAVSGSNVATFLALWWLVLAPLSMRPRRRAVLGLVGIGLFVLITRAEPSVVRAGAMAGVVLSGRVVGWSIDAWTALGLAITSCLLVAGDLGADVGFILSVAATLGVLAGSSLIETRPRPVGTVLSASVAAQVAVAPILILSFGTVPLAAPLANLLSAPLVALSTTVGGVGALAGSSLVMGLASIPASLVLTISRWAAPGPQLDWRGLLAALVVIAVSARFRQARPGIALGLVALGVWWWSGSVVDRPAVVFLDVGQGDSILLLGDGFNALVDAGPNPVRIVNALAEYRIDHLDLIVLTHGHADHIDGMRALLGRVQVGGIWQDVRGEQSEAADWVRRRATDLGIPIESPPVGTRVARGGFVIDVLGPERRYAHANDQSIVLEVAAADRRMLLTGDVERIAQAELDISAVDVLKVPHHGGATSDLAWLRSTDPSLAIISVGENSFGHPNPEVVAELESVGSVVLRTDVSGDIIIEPSGVRTR